MLRTTVYLPDELVNLAKLKAIEEKVPMTQLVKEGLEVRLGIKKVKTKSSKFVWKTYNLGLGSKRWKREWAYE
jgi:hypothetical protein